MTAGTDIRHGSSEDAQTAEWSPAPWGTPARQAPVRDRLPAAGPVVLRVLFGLGAIGALLPWYTTATHFAGTSNVVTSIGRTAGLLAVYLCLVQLLLMARVPWLERAVGFDRLTAWHRSLGMSTVLLIAAHAAFIVWGYSLVDDRSFFGEGWTVITTYPAMIRGTIAGVVLLVVGISSARWARRKLPYELWWLLHLTTYVAVILAFAHQVESGDQFVGHDVMAQVLRGIYLAVVAAVLWWRVIVPLRDAYAHRMVVADVQAEGDNAASIVIRGEALRDLDPRPGQYVLVRFLTRKLWMTAHPYSLSSIAGDDALRVTVRGDGDHSLATLQVRPGTQVITEGPFGRFTADAARHGAPALLIGGGSGIVPLRAIGEELAAQGRDVVVVQRASKPAGLLLGAELRAAAAGGQITLHQIVGRRQDLGRDPLSHVQLAALVPDIAARDVYVCGPAGMMRTAVGSARALGVPPEHLHLEEFDW